MKGMKEHYVPQFYLKNFGDQIYLYDKQTRKVSQSTPRDVAFQRGFYVDSGNDAASKLEGAMSQFEGSASMVISNIIRTESVAGLSDTDRATLCDFVAFQFARTPEFRDRRREMVQSMLDGLVRQMEITDWHIKEKEENAGPVHLASMLDYVNWARPYLLQMRVCLLKNDTDIPLWTSDNPVVRHNDLTGKLGLGSPGVQFHLPLTPKLLLCFYDGTYIDLLDDAAGDVGDSEERRILARSIQETVNVEKAGAIHTNQLQTMFSTRFVFSNKRCFHMMDAFLEASGDYNKRHVFHSLSEPGAISRVDVLGHNLQNALWQYLAARQDADIRRAFVNLYVSLEIATNLGGIGDANGEEFDASVRKLTGDPVAPIDKLRRLYYNIKRNGHHDLHADEALVVKQVKVLRQMAAKVMLRRLDELRARD